MGGNISICPKKKKNKEGFRIWHIVCDNDKIKSKGRFTELTNLGFTDCIVAIIRTRNKKTNHHLSNRPFSISLLCHFDTTEDKVLIRNK